MDISRKRPVKEAFGQEISRELGVQGGHTDNEPDSVVVCPFPENGAYEFLCTLNAQEQQRHMLAHIGREMLIRIIAAKQATFRATPDSFSRDVTLFPPERNNAPHAPLEPTLERKCITTALPTPPVRLLRNPRHLKCDQATNIARHLRDSKWPSCCQDHVLKRTAARTG